MLIGCVGLRGCVIPVNRPALVLVAGDALMMMTTMMTGR